MNETFTLLVAPNHSPAAFARVITGSADEILERHGDYSFAFVCSHQFRILDADGCEMEMDEFLYQYTPAY